MTLTWQTPQGQSSNNSGWVNSAWGSKLKMNKKIKVHGVYIWTTNNCTYKAKIWDEANQNLLIESDLSQGVQGGGWVYFPFVSPVILEANKIYMVGGYSDGGAHGYGPISYIPASTTSNDVTFTFEPFQMFCASGDTYPSSINNNSNAMMLGFEFELELSSRFLVQVGEVVKKFSNSWQDIGLVPVTDEMFRTHGMLSLDIITEAQWKSIPQDSKILAYTESDKVFTADVTVHNLYDGNSKNYHGTGIIETETEELPITRKFLMINAEHENCTFKYSLNNGGIWTDIMPGELKDITKENGIQLKIQVNLPTDDATLTAISYAWA